MSRPRKAPISVEAELAAASLCQRLIGHLNVDDKAVKFYEGERDFHLDRARQLEERKVG